MSSLDQHWRRTADHRATGDFEQRPFERTTQADSQREQIFVPVQVHIGQARDFCRAHDQINLIFAYPPFSLTLQTHTATARAERVQPLGPEYTIEMVANLTDQQHPRHRPTTCNAPNLAFADLHLNRPFLHG